MITLKEYKIYLKIKRFIEAKGCEESFIIPQLINGVGIIPAYVPLIIESDDMEQTKYYSLSAAARGCGLLKQTMVYAYRNGGTRIEEKEELRCLVWSGWLRPAGEAPLGDRRWINLTSRLN